MKTPLLAFAAASGLLLALSPTPARACSAGICGAPAAFPETPTIPANVGGVFLNPGYGTLAGSIPTPSLQLSVLGAAPVDLAVTTVDRTVGVFERVAVRTTAPLTVGSTLTLRAANRCDLLYGADGGVPALADLGSWTVSAPVPLPTTLGTIAVQVGNQSIPQPTYDGSCDTQISAPGAFVTLALSSDATPWEDVFVYETVVDGQVFLPVVTASPFNGYSSQSQAFGGSWFGRGRDIVFADCGSTYGGIPAGAHTVFMRGVLPDGTVVTTPTVAFRLSCSAQRAHGCSAAVAAPTGAPTGPLAVLAVSLAAVLGLRRRRRR